MERMRNIDYTSNIWLEEDSQLSTKYIGYKYSHSNGPTGTEREASCLKYTQLHGFAILATSASTRARYQILKFELGGPTSSSSTAEAPKTQST